MGKGQTLAQGGAGQEFTIERRVIERQQVRDARLPLERLAEFLDHTGRVTLLQFRDHQRFTRKSASDKPCPAPIKLLAGMRCFFSFAFLFGRLQFHSGMSYRQSGVFRKIQVASTTAAKLDIFSVHESGQDTNGQPHVAFTANAIAHNRDTLFLTELEAVEVGEDLRRDFSRNSRMAASFSAALTLDFVCQVWRASKLSITSLIMSYHTQATCQIKLVIHNLLMESLINAAGTDAKSSEPGISRRKCIVCT